MAKILAVISFGKKDVDINRSNLIIQGTLPIEPMNQIRSQENIIGWHILFKNPFAGGAKAASAQRTLILSKQSAVAF